MKKTILFSAAIVAVAAITLISSCRHKNAAPVVTLDEPADAEIFAVGDTVHVEGDLTDDESLHEASILLFRTGVDSPLVEYPYVHDLKSYHFHHHVPVTNAGTYKVQVTAEDHDGEMATKTVTVTVN